MKQQKEEILSVSVDFEIRFSEVDSMQLVWHGNYAKYFEDARIAFGKKFGLDYNTIYSNGCYAPLVEAMFSYKFPLRFGDCPKISITYRPTDAAKIIYDYEIHNRVTGKLCTAGRTVQVFLNQNYELLWNNPSFYEEWKEKWHQL